MIGVQRLRDISFLLICYRTGQTVMGMIRVSTDTMTFILTSLTLPEPLTPQARTCGTRKVVDEIPHKSSYVESSGLFISSNVLQSFLQISLIVAFMVFHFFIPLLTCCNGLSVRSGRASPLLLSKPFLSPSAGRWLSLNHLLV